MFKKDSLLILLVLTCSIFFSAGCGGGGGSSGSAPTPHKYEEYGVVESRGSIWYWIGVNKSFIADQTDAVFTEDGKVVTGSLEEGKSFFFVNKEAYRHFVPQSREELVSLQLPDTDIKRVEDIGATVTVLMDWIVGSNATNHLTVHVGRPLATRQGTIVTAGNVVTIWVHQGPEMTHPYTQWGEVKYVENSLLWWEIKVQRAGPTLPEHLVLDEDGREVINFQTGRKYYFASKEELENFLPLRREELKELLHPKDWGEIKFFEEYGVQVPKPVHFWLVPDHPSLTIHFGSSTKATPGTKVDGAFTAWVTF